MNRRAVAGIAVLGAVAPIAFAQTFRDLPDTWCQDRGLWRSILATAQYRQVHAIMIGDSQETCPQGAGSVYVPAFQARLASFYGACGMTPWCHAGSSFGGGNPWGEWLVRSGHASPGTRLVDQILNWVPPGLRVAITSSNNRNNVNNNQEYGWLLIADPAAQWADPDAQASGDWFDLSEGFYVDLYGITAPGSSELRAKVSYTFGGPTFYGPLLATITTSMGLDAPEGVAKKQSFGPFSVPPGAKPQIEVFGTDPSRTATILTARFRSVARARGIVLTDLAEGGYQASSFLSLHGACGNILSAMDAEFAVLCFGANEAGNGVPLSAHEQSLRNLISFVRSHTREDFPVIVMEDVYRQVRSEYAPILDGLSSVGLSIAESDPSVLFVNSRKLTDALGWNSSNSQLFLYDHVHYSAVGAQEKARVEVETLLREFGCAIDITNDGFVDFFDYDAFVTAYETGSPARDADFNADGFFDFFDYDGFVEAYENGC